ncbi:class I SAM-dependent methyltransferase [uncultured Microscilla sp.]|uniref:class I SAM-dependent methyltransferase n=1 Tax=uncultured Microscilla sp. TaxID=432653 RepID=UPI00260726CE|nr:class I SAM-dependent methyltransferase [uncultured Microscilla sp.]
MKNLKTFTFTIVLCLMGTTYASAQYKSDDWKDRDKWQKVPQLLKAMNIRPGAKVADVGCHQGYMTMHLAKAVGKTGKVYGVDLNTYRLEALKEEATEQGYNNIVTIKGEENDPLLPKGQLDAIIMIDTYHHILEKPLKYLKKLKKALKPGGRLVIVESIRTYRKQLSRDEQKEKHNLDIGFVRYDFKKVGLIPADFKYPLTRWKNKKEVWVWFLAGVKPKEGSR